MKIDKFWQIIDEVQPAGTDDEAHAAALQERLSRLKPKAIEAFQKHFDRLQAELYDWGLWGAAYVIRGGCSDDAFTDFRAWVISQGHRVYKAAKHNPDSLADVQLSDDEGERVEQTNRELFSYAADEAYEEKTGEEMDYDETQEPEDPAGEEWDEDDLPTRFPRLWALYGDV